MKNKKIREIILGKPLDPMKSAGHLRCDHPPGRLFRLDQRRHAADGLLEGRRHLHRARGGVEHPHLLYLLWDALPVEGETLNASTFKAIIDSASQLFVAANTSFWPVANGLRFVCAAHIPLPVDPAGDGKRHPGDGLRRAGDPVLDAR